jgi:hypothetical protein
MLLFDCLSVENKRYYYYYIIIIVLCHVFSFSIFWIFVFFSTYSQRICSLTFLSSVIDTEDKLPNSVVKSGDKFASVSVPLQHFLF